MSKVPLNICPICRSVSLYSRRFRSACNNFALSMAIAACMAKLVSKPA